MKRIKLTRGQYALVDDQDYDHLNKFKWQAKPMYKRNTREIVTYYAVGSHKIDGKPKFVQMHRFILNAIKDVLVDHKNGNGIDNQRENIRTCTASQNCHNSKAYGNTSKYLCVFYTAKAKGWRVTIRVNSKIKYIGQFRTELEAGIIANIAIRKYHGEFANPNKLIKISY